MGDNMKTVRDEITRLYNLSKNPTWSKYNCSSEGAYYYDLCSVEDKTISLEDFYKKFPYHNPNFDSEYWQKQHQRWREIWKQN